MQLLNYWNKLFTSNCGGCVRKMEYAMNTKFGNKFTGICGEVSSKVYLNRLPKLFDSVNHYIQLRKICGYGAVVEVIRFLHLIWKTELSGWNKVVIVQENFMQFGSILGLKFESSVIFDFYKWFSTVSGIFLMSPFHWRNEVLPYDWGWTWLYPSSRWCRCH